jgi:predicted metal-dependent phosphoesterase TrpH
MIDLHMHSIFSDGTMTPECLVMEARQLELEAIALTDHDNTAGIDELLAACDAGNGSRELLGIPGVEISAETNDGILHLLGYFLDHTCAALSEGLHRIRTGRETRNRTILQKLNELGIALEWEDVSRHAGSDVVGRPHFAAALIDKGQVKSRREAFERYLAKGQPAYADRFRFSPEEGINLITKSGGVAVLAHPSTLTLEKRALRERVAALRDMGLGGIEVYYPSHGDEQTASYEKLARELDLVTTGGSDYHGAASPHIAMGRGFGSLKIPFRIVDDLRSRCSR